MNTLQTSTSGYALDRFKLLAAALFLTIGTVCSNAQFLEPSFSFGYGSFAMGDLKRFQDNIIEQVPFPVRITDNFPMHVTYEASIMVPFAQGRHKVGLSFGSMSTGSRANVSDYSGSYTIDHLVKGTKISTNYEVLMLKFSVFELAFNGNLSYLKTTYQLQEDFVLGDQQRQEEVVDLAASGFCIEPRFKLSIPIKRLVFSLQAGYMIDASSPLHLKDDKDAELQLDDESIGADFSGIRLNTVIAFRIG